jgi:pSer/pThr/pTyr-binding forkhead associated (FHA) protein
MRAQLIPLDGGQPVAIVKDMTLVGRKESCDLRIDHKSVSKMHCVIVKTDGLLLIRDLGSTNGTRVNGTRVRRAALLPNDQLSIAHFKYKVDFGPEVPPPVSPGERTQQIDQKDLDRLIDRATGGTNDSSLEMPAIQVQANALPDVYPDEAKPPVK